AATTWAWPFTASKDAGRYFSVQGRDAIWMVRMLQKQRKKKVTKLLEAPSSYFSGCEVKEKWTSAAGLS
ncbi:MAG: hypothetical protein VX446_02355, partial [Bacteroidota bacterium]|nr:hypothetical protein [Bacteroidota bacterium]